MKEFKDRVAVITGAASGIGLAMANRFADAGMKLVLADANAETLKQVVTGLKERTEVIGAATDVSKPESVEALAEQTLGAFGAVHLLCNNAGVGGDLVTSWRQSLKSWEWVLGVNLWGVIHGIKTFLPIMLSQKTEGHIINTASMAGLVSLPFGAPYNVSKHAVVTLSESLYFELMMENEKVKVSVLCPGWVKTGLVDSARNGPEMLNLEESPRSKMELAWKQAVIKLVDSGIPAADVAELVFNAIEQEQFYIFSHPEMLVSVRKRMNAILEHRNPSLDLPKFPDTKMPE
jgi:NAD(P)-dependent dehydrogenase (short-subunit alcohol dehydrogenase family)